jgi:hypothetical protein
MKIKILALLCSLSIFIPYLSHAEDIPVGHPLRKQLLDAARPSLLFEARDRFRVIELWATNKWAFLCTMVLEQNGELSRTDGWLDIGEAILQKKEGNWVVVSKVENLVLKVEPGVCRLGTLNVQSQLSDTALENALTAPPWSKGRR